MTIKNEFLEKLGRLCDDYSAEIYYTNEDDGIHISIFGEDIFVGTVEADNYRKEFSKAMDT